MTTKSLVWNGKAITARMRAAQVAGINQTMSDCVQHAKENHPWTNQTTHLEGAIKIQPYAHEVPGGVSGTWGVFDMRQGLILELGGTIEPKNGKYLSIPISAEAKHLNSPRDMTNLAYVQSIKGQPMLVDQDTGTVHWLLKRQVTIKPHPYLRPAADALYPALADNIRKAYDKLKPTVPSAPSGGSAGVGDNV